MVVGVWSFPKCCEAYPEHPRAILLAITPGSTMFNAFFVGRSSSTDVWLVVWNMTLFFHILGIYNHPNWLSYFSEGFKPPNSLAITPGSTMFKAFFVGDHWDHPQQMLFFALKWRGETNWCSGDRARRLVVPGQGAVTTLKQWNDGFTICFNMVQ